MTLEQLAHQIAQLRIGESRPLALWFVDRPAELHHLLKERSTPYEVVFTDHQLTFCGLRVHTCSSEMTLYSIKGIEGTHYTAPFYQKPGVWIEMSDGNHVRLQDDK